MDVVDAIDPGVLARKRPRIHELFPKRLVKDFVDERALSRTRGAGNGDHHPEGELHIHRLEIVFIGATNGKRSAVSFASFGRPSDCPAAGEKLTRRRLLRSEHVPKL